MIVVKPLAETRDGPLTLGSPRGLKAVPGCGHCCQDRVSLTAEYIDEDCETVTVSGGQAGYGTGMMDWREGCGFVDVCGHRPVAEIPFQAREFPVLLLKRD